MGSNVSLSPEEENQLNNLFQINQGKQKSKQDPNGQPVVMMRMMAPTALVPQPRVKKQNQPVKKRQARKVQQPPAKQVYPVGEHH
jgi:hypothetical protein